jgi:hypothetical protein
MDKLLKDPSTHTSLIGFRNLEHFEEIQFFLTYMPTDLNSIQYTLLQSIIVNSLKLHSQNMPSVNLRFMTESHDRSIQANSKTVPSK